MHGSGKMTYACHSIFDGEFERDSRRDGVWTPCLPNQGQNLCIQPMHVALNVDVEGWSQGNGAGLSLFDPHCRQHQRFNVELCDARVRSYKFVAEHSGKCIDVPGAGVDYRRGTQLIQYTQRSTGNIGNQRFQFKKVFGTGRGVRGRPVFVIECRDRELVWDIRGDGRSNGSHLIVWPHHGRKNQQFEFFYHADVPNKTPV
jgi:hypothetical protein